MIAEKDVLKREIEGEREEWESCGENEKSNFPQTFIYFIFPISFI